MFTSLTLLVLAGLLGPLLAVGRRPLAPVLVGELIAGAILGKTWLHLIASTTQPFPEFSAVGFAMLMLEGGNEVDLRSAELRLGAVRGNLALLIALAWGKRPRPSFQPTGWTAPAQGAPYWLGRPWRITAQPPRRAGLSALFTAGHFTTRLPVRRDLLGAGLTLPI